MNERRTKKYKNIKRSNQKQKNKKDRKDSYKKCAHSVTKGKDDREQNKNDRDEIKQAHREYTLDIFSHLRLFDQHLLKKKKNISIAVSRSRTQNARKTCERFMGKGIKKRKKYCATHC